MAETDEHGNTYDSATSTDLAAVRDLYWRDLGRKPNDELLQRLVGNSPFEIARAPSDELIGFAYATPDATPPDTIELRNILVARGWRNMRVGHQLLRRVEAEAIKLKYAAIVLYNSDTYVNADVKGDPTSFYVRNGYGCQRISTATQYFWKTLE